MISIVHNSKSRLTPLAATMNRGRCHEVVRYLSKEDNVYEAATGFFTHYENHVDEDKAQRLIDENNKGLKLHQDKFYMLTINPSQKELSALIERVTGRKYVVCFDVLFPEEKQKVYEALRLYTRNAMNNYARSFGRKNVKDGEDLVYFAKIEVERHYKGTDKDVIDGLANNGDLKPGLQLHVHVIVSRNSKHQKSSLSPFGAGNRKNVLSGRSRIGFDKSGWGMKNAFDFETFFGYTDPLSFKKNGGEIYVGMNPTFSDTDGHYEFEGPSSCLTDKEKMDWYYNYLLKTKKAAIFTKLIEGNVFATEKQILNASLLLYRFAKNPKQVAIDLLIKTLVRSFMMKEL